MSKWQQVKLGDVSESCLGKMLDQHKNKGELQPYLANIDVRWGEFDLEQLGEMKFELHEQERYGLRYGDLVICEGGEPGRCAIWKDQIPNMKIQKALHRVRADLNVLDNRFLFYWFLLAGKTGELEQYFTGATIKHMPGQKLKEVKIPLPPLEIQRKIADVLSAYDDLIENNRKQIKLLEEAAQRLYKEWFIDLRFPDHESTPIIDGIPEGWELKKLGSIIKLRSGFAFKSKDFCSKGNFKIVTIKNVQDGVFDYENTDTITEIPHNMPKYCILSDGDILLSLTGNIGRVCMVTEKNCLLNQRVAKLETQYPGFAYCLFRNKDFCYSINNLANGAAQQNLSPLKTEEMKVLIPSIQHLSLFEKQIHTITDKILMLYKNIIVTKLARNYLLPKLMTGELIETRNSLLTKLTNITFK